MTFLRIHCLFLSLALVASQVFEETSLEDLSYKLSRIRDSVSIELNSANYLHYLTNISDPWLILFFEPQKIASVKAHKDWKTFATSPKPENFHTNLGLINFSFEKILARKLKIPESPCYLYITRSHIYYYTGGKNLETLQKFESDQLYLQYDRRLFPITENQHPPVVSLYTANPVFFIIIVSLVIFSIFNIFSTLQIKPPKSPEILREKKTN